ncbi:hypothetical protein H6P81_011428 [Aristolochia fimbriata]|uniref:Uncharacterized protein n=1 Tax=Aristolochia fimbriata TaxID=158543 RepID=A0AAV7ERH0_ARIFI|nr:hypothetical protein H6P81_011428 [Aristolochia fimbriata]
MGELLYWKKREEREKEGQTAVNTIVSTSKTATWTHMVGRLIQEPGVGEKWSTTYKNPVDPFSRETRGRKVGRRGHFETREPGSTDGPTKMRRPLVRARRLSRDRPVWVNDERDQTA